MCPAYGNWTVDNGCAALDHFTALLTLPGVHEGIVDIVVATYIQDKIWMQLSP